MTNQTDLDFRPQAGVKDRAKVPGNPDNAAELARRMIAILEVHADCWMTRARFADFGFSSDGRECRAGRAASHGRIIAGQNGFRLTRHATIDENRTWDNLLDSQIKALTRQRLHHKNELARQQHGRKAI